MKYAYDIRIGPHMFEDSIGQLIATDVIIGREGYQEYYENDVLKNGSYKIIKVLRPWEEVKKSAPSFEAKPIVEQHPDESVNITIDNIDKVRKGHVQNVREGKAEFEGKEINVLFADLVFSNKETKEKVKSGELREVSCGYFYEIDIETMSQYDIRGEHVALVREGRAGISKILDGIDGQLFDLAKYLKLDTEEKRCEFMAKIPDKDLEGMKIFFNDCKDESFSQDEIDMTIKIVDREINKRNHEGMGLNKCQDENDQIIEIPAHKIKRGDVIHLPKHKDADRVVAKVDRDKHSGEVIIMNKSDEYLHIASWDELIQLETRGKAQDLFIVDQPKGEDVELELSFDEEDVAWITVKAENIEIGDIVSKVRSTTMYEVTGIENDGESYTIEVRTVDDRSITYTWQTSVGKIFDVLIDAKTNEKVTFNPEKAQDEDLISKAREKIKELDALIEIAVSNNDFEEFGRLGNERNNYARQIAKSRKGNDADNGTILVKYLQIGDNIIDSKGDVLEITNIVKNDNGTYNVISGDEDVYIEAEPDVEVTIE